MKKVFKAKIQFILGFILGAIVSGMGVYAATLNFASGDVEHTKSDGTKTTVSAALNELYTKASSTTATLVYSSHQYNEGGITFSYKCAKTGTYIITAVATSVDGTRYINLPSGFQSYNRVTNTGGQYSESSFIGKCNANSTLSIYVYSDTHNHDKGVNIYYVGN